MEEPMATSTLELPIKRAQEEIGSGSGLKEEASKKAKVEPGSDLYFMTYPEFVEYRGEEFDRFNWYDYEEEMASRYKLRELRYYLISKGQVDRAESIRSLEELDEEEWDEFNAKPWDLEATTPGPYDDYQRLVAWHDIRDCSYRYCLCSYDCDVAYLRFFEELKETLERNSSSSDAARIALDISKKYGKFSSIAIDYAFQDSCCWWHLEELKKDLIPVFTKLCHEVLKNGMDIEQVVNETIGQVNGQCNRGEAYILEDVRRRWGATRHVINQVKRYITKKNEENFVDEVRIKRLVERILKEDPPNSFKLFTYADYVNMKLQLAKHLRII